MTATPLRRTFARLVSSRPGRSGRIAVIVVAAVFAGLALVGLAAHWIAPRPVWQLGLAAVSPYLMGGSAIALLVLLAGRQWLLAGASLVLLAVCVSTQVHLYTRTDPPAASRTVTVMTSNLQLGRGDAHAVVHAVVHRHVDLLMLEELTPEAEARLASAGLGTQLPYHVSASYSGPFGTGLWSRYPLSDGVTHGGYTFALVTARVALPGTAGPTDVVALHMGGPWPDSRLWRRDIARLPALLRRLAGRVALVGGDFNATPDVSQFRTVLGAGFADAADQAGDGITRTWPADRWFPPLIAIDHVLTRGAVATGVDTAEIPGSDHRALIATIAVPGIR